MEIKAALESKQYVTVMVLGWWKKAASGDYLNWTEARCYLHGYYMGLGPSPLRDEIHLLYDICTDQFCPAFQQEAA